jgi:hypothetical protein
MRLLVFCGDLLLSDTRELLSNARLFIRAGFEGDPVSFESGWFPIFYLRLFAPHTLSSSFLPLLLHGYGHSVAYLGPWAVSHRRSKNIRGVRTKGTGRFVSEDSLSGVYLYLLDLGLTPDPPVQHPCKI